MVLSKAQREITGLSYSSLDNLRDISLRAFHLLFSTGHGKVEFLINKCTLNPDKSQLEIGTENIYRFCSVSILHVKDTTTRSTTYNYLTVNIRCSSLIKTRNV